MSGAPARHCEVAIVGGGMVGASLALALSGSGRDVVLIEAQAPEEPVAEAVLGTQAPSQPSFDARTTALGNGARRIFETLGVWAAIAERAAAIRGIHVSDAGHFGFARLEAREHGLAAFGYSVGNRQLGAVLWQALRARTALELWSPARLTQVRLEQDGAWLKVELAGGERTLRAQLVVAADGAESLLKQAAGIGSSRQAYGQVALVTQVRTDCRAGAIAYERFTDSGPIALLPRPDGAYALIWTVPPSAAPALLDCSEHEFCSRLQQRFGWRVGGMQQVARRHSYPLTLVRAQASIGVRVALVGNAAQALHPIAAQGFNLGLRDAAVMAELIAQAGDPGAPSTLEQYARRRAADRAGMIAFTDRLVKLFADPRGAMIAARDLALLAFDLSPPAKRALARLSWGFGPLPRLARGLPVSAP